MIVVKLESRILVLCRLECGQVDRRRPGTTGDVIRGDDGPSVLGDGGFIVANEKEVTSGDDVWVVVVGN